MNDNAVSQCDSMVSSFLDNLYGIMGLFNVNFNLGLQRREILIEI